MLLAQGILPSIQKPSQKRPLECVKRHILSRIGGETMNKTPTKEIMDDEIVYRNRRELPPDREY
jgi:hypothetical protein